MTFAEKIFWEQIRAKRFMNLKFKRQYIVLNYILDFYCPKLRLGIEIDGKIHEQQKKKDYIRKRLIQYKGINIVRFKNEEIINNINGILQELKSICTKLF